MAFVINKSLLVIFIIALVRFGLAQNVLISPHGSKMKIACETCHTTADWNNIPGWKFNHDRTGFSLFGSHKNAECKDCHQSLIFNQIGVTCMDCHTDVHKSELGIECENCHNSQSWENRSEIMNQHSQTNFPLVGVHANLDCESCHINEQQRQFSTLSVECQSCHLTDYMKTINPSHQKADFNLDCQNCHLQVRTNWKGSAFKHSASFVLSGAHKMVECVACHTSEYIGLSSECYSCHVSDFQTALNPDHSSFGFPTACEQCHNDIRWERAVFDHLAESGFLIEGAHQSILCMDCHINNQFTGLAKDCYGCHQADFNLALDPNHIENDFSEDCLECHSTNAWEPATFDHSVTQFPLTGAHNNVNCADCHTNGYTQQLPTDCFSCHELDFTTVSDPNHLTNNFDHDCLICHTTTAWEPATFDHSVTQFPLTGAHNNVNCADCHTNGYIQQLPTDCFSCHELDFTTVSDPNHVTNNFDHDCLICHSTTAWSPATFNHANTQFPLTGAHINVDCSICHASGYQNTPLECVACHQTDYDQTADPNHLSAQFPTTCETCHSAVAWEQTSWDHDGQYFPINSGAHREKWDDCTDCHVNPANYTQFECINCHDHNEQDMWDKHKEEAGYEYDSIRCYECHPNGKS